MRRPHMLQAFRLDRAGYTSEPGFHIHGQGLNLCLDCLVQGF